jgi:hypothetical protein
MKNNYDDIVGGGFSYAEGENSATQNTEVQTQTTDIMPLPDNLAPDVPVPSDQKIGIVVAPDEDTNSKKLLTVALFVFVGYIVYKAYKESK